ncbi:integumentary mucin C.1-like isoform X3 [Halichondria panicea]|uniref:integumentary mucin C.1-like isoform X3 n=1 Tax=Halichondria panicea TaxID=6063 RepID=UPI00312B696E
MLVFHKMESTVLYSVATMFALSVLILLCTASVTPPETSSEATGNALTCSCSPNFFHNCVNGQCNATETDMFGCRISVEYYPLEDIHRVYYFCVRSDIDYFTNCGGGGASGDVFYRYLGDNGDIEICCVNGSDCNTRQLYEQLRPTPTTTSTTTTPTATPITTPITTPTTTELSTVETTMATTAYSTDDDVTTELSTVETTMATITDNGGTTILAGTDANSVSSVHARPILSTVYIAVCISMLKVF